MGLSELVALQRRAHSLMRPTFLSSALHRSFSDIGHSVIALNTIQQRIAQSARPMILSSALHRSFSDIGHSAIALNTVQKGIAQSVRPMILSSALHRSFSDIGHSVIALNTIQQRIAQSALSTILSSALHRSFSDIGHSVIALNTIHRRFDWALSTGHSFQPLSQQILKTLAPFTEVDQFEESGWFPHSTFPSDLLGSNDELVLTYYRDNWPIIKETIEDELGGYVVADDAKEAVRQALTAHEIGLYRLVPTSLFAAVERAVRVCLYDDQVGPFSVKKLLVEPVGALPIAAFRDGRLSYAGFTQLNRHLYENIHDDSVRERFMNASIPNRHAAIHGLVTYSSAKSSLNAIFLAMYVFRMLTALTVRNLRGAR